jgi:TnpA family transposase
MADNSKENQCDLVFRRDSIKLMPRIKDINKLIFFKPDGRARYTHINELFTEPANYKVIKSNLADMLRVAMSIKEGKVTASTIVRRLGERGIRNSLYYAFRELGRVVRTQYLLEYITDIKMRETIQAATCKSEAFNDFVKWIFFYNNGEVQENLRHEQNKMINYNHLVANLVILHNVNSMTKVIRRLRKEGLEITDEMLGGIAPYRRGHLDLLGEYHLKIKKQRSRQAHQLF